MQQEIGRHGQPTFGFSTDTKMLWGTRGGHCYRNLGRYRLNLYLRKSCVECFFKDSAAEKMFVGIL